MDIKLSYDVPPSMPWLTRAVPLLHIAEGVFTLFIICVVAPAITIQIANEGGSQAGPNYTLFVCILTILMPFFLVLFPWLNENTTQCKAVGKFFSQPRTILVLSCLNTALWFSAAIAITVYANAADTCDLKGRDSYADAWSKQCTSVKVAAAFSWLNFFFWLVSLVFSAFIFWQYKQNTRREAAQDAYHAYNEADMDRDIEKSQSPHPSYTVPTESNYPPSPPPQHGQEYSSPAMQQYSTNYLTAAHAPPAPTPPMSQAQIINSPQQYSQQHIINSPQQYSQQHINSPQQYSQQHIINSPQQYSQQYIQNSPQQYSQQQYSPYTTPQQQYASPYMAPLPTNAPPMPPVHNYHNPGY